MVDCGDAFARAPEPYLSTAAVQQRGQLMVDAFNRMGMLAYTLGERDLSVGPELLRELAGRAQFRFLAANLLNADGRPLFESSVLTELGGRKVGLLGLIGARAGVRQEDLTKLGATLAPPAEIARVEVEKLEAAGAELILVLSHLGTGEEAEVLRAAPAIRFFIGGHTGRQLARPLKITEAQSGSSAWLVEAGNRGKYQGQLDLYVGADSAALDQLNDAGEGDAVRASIGELERSIASLTGQRDGLSKSPTPAAQQEARAKNIAASIARSEERLKAERQQLTTMKALDPTRPAFKNVLVPLVLSIAEQPEIAGAVTALQATGLLNPQPTRSPAIPSVIAPRREGLPTRLTRPAPRQPPGVAVPLPRQPKAAVPPSAPPKGP